MWNKLLQKKIHWRIWKRLTETKMLNKSPNKWTNVEQKSKTEHTVIHIPCDSRGSRHKMTCTSFNLWRQYLFCYTLAVLTVLATKTPKDSMLFLKKGSRLSKLQEPYFRLNRHHRWSTDHIAVTSPCHRSRLSFTQNTVHLQSGDLHVKYKTQKV